MYSGELAPELRGIVHFSLPSIAELYFLHPIRLINQVQLCILGARII